MGFRWTIATALVATLWAGRVEAQAMTAPTVGTGLSGPATADAAAVYWNPGALAYIERPTLLLGGHIIVGHIGYTRERRATYQRPDSLNFALPIAPESVDSTKTGSAQSVGATPFGAAPTLFGAFPISKRVVVGFGIYAPFAALVSFDEGGAQKWAIQRATIVMVQATPAISYRFHDALSVGAGVSYVLGYGAMSKVQDFGAIDDVGRALARPPISQNNSFGANAPPGVRELNSMARPFELENALGHGITFNVGIASRPTPKLLLGLSYQHSVDMALTGTFRLNMNDDFFTKDLVSQGMAFKPEVAGTATLRFPLPRSLRIAAAYDATPKLRLGTQLGYTTWSQVEAFDVSARSPDLVMPKVGLSDTAHIVLPRRWQDTVAIDVSARLQLTKSLAGWVLAGYRSPASPDATIDVASPDGNRIVANAGVWLALSQNVALLGEVKMQTILPRTVVGSDYDLGNGTYSLTLFAFGGHVEWKL
jgi:long-chain fatty acid transport protein